VSRRRRFWLRAVWISVAAVLIPPMFGLKGTMVGMIAFIVLPGVLFRYFTLPKLAGDSPADFKARSGPRE
jgi:hypothetical protein